EIPEAIFADLNEEVVDVDLINADLLAQPDHELPGGAKKVIVVEIVPKRRAQDEATAEVVEARRVFRGCIERVPREADVGLHVAMKFEQCWRGKHASLPDRHSRGGFQLV